MISSASLGEILKWVRLLVSLLFDNLREKKIEYGVGVIVGVGVGVGKGVEVEGSLDGCLVGGTGVGVASDRLIRKTDRLIGV